MGEHIGPGTSFCTNEMMDAVFSLRIVSQFLEKVESEPLYWKWIVINFHNALQSLMAGILYNEDRIYSARRREHKKELQKWRDFSDPAKRQKMIDNNDLPKDLPMGSLMELYEKLKSPDLVNNASLFQPFHPCEEDEKRMRLLNFWRNYFMHFKPALKFLSSWDYFKLMPDCVSFAEFLIQSPRLGEAQREAKELVLTLKTQIESLRQKYIEKYPQLADDE